MAGEEGKITRENRDDEEKQDPPAPPPESEIESQNAESDDRGDLQLHPEFQSAPAELAPTSRMRGLVLRVVYSLYSRIFSRVFPSILVLHPAFQDLVATITTDEDKEEEDEAGED